MESTMTPVDRDNLSSIRSAIDAKLHEDGVYQQIRELILSKAPALTEDDRPPPPPSSDDPDDATPQHKIEDDLIREVLQSELVQQLLDAIKLDKELKQSQTTTGDDDDEQAENEPLPVSEPTLFLRLAGGRAFVDQLTQDDDDLNCDAADGIASVTQHQIGLVRQFFRVIVSFQGQRQSTRDVACCVDPPFNEHFRFGLAKRRTRSGRTKSGGLYEIEVVSPWEALCLVDEPVHITLVKLTKKVTSFQHATGAVWHELRRELIAVHRLDWRRVLGSTLQLVHVPIQLVDKMKVPVGTLDVRMDLLHFHRTAAIAKDVTAYLSKEALEKNTLSHAFYRYAKEWWHTYRTEMGAMETNVRYPPTGASEREESLEDRQFVLLDQRSRLVKLFAEDEEGRFRMVCKFLSALRSPLAVKSPSEAARFVALLPLETTSVVGGVTADAWRSVATTLAVGKGDTQDHAVLLASLLLGCGLDAYVCIGTVVSTAKQRRERAGDTTRQPILTSERGRVWVLTRDPDHPNGTQGVLFWESTTGDRHSVRNGAAQRQGFVSIDCVFSATQFYANLQPRQWKLSEYSFHFEDTTSWQALDARRIADLPSTVSSVVVTSPDVAAVIPMEQQWTRTLRRDISSQRRAKGLATKWSDELSFYLQPALNSYEMERLYHVPQLENELFQHTIKRFVKEGSTFQAVPLMFRASLTPSDQAIESLLDNAIARKTMDIQGRAAQFGLAVRCFAYPEGVFVAWVMLAVSYTT